MDEHHDVHEPGRHALLLSFDTDDREFARGFEAGRVWATLQESAAPIEVIVHASNTEMVLRMAEALGRTADGEQLDEIWTQVAFGEAG